MWLIATQGHQNGLNTPALGAHHSRISRGEGIPTRHTWPHTIAVRCLTARLVRLQVLC
jgi:hypothetical protein